jgi:hypothetical protein
VASWIADSKTKIVKPRILTTPLIDRFARPVFGRGDEDPIKRRINYEKVEQWLDEIPEAIKSRAVAALGRFQFLAIEACQQHAAFLDFLEQEHRQANGNFIIAAWVLHRQLSQTQEYRKIFNHRLMSQKRAEVLKFLFEAPVPQLFQKVVHRCAHNMLDDESLWGLLAACRHKQFSSVVAAQKTIVNPGFLIAWQSLPEWLYIPQLVKCLMELPEDTRALESVIAPAILSAEGTARRRIRQSLRSAKNLAELEDRLYNLSFAFKLATPFPAAPFSGTKLLRPVRTGLQLQSEGKFMHNCVAGYASSVISGQHYFYHFHGEEQATVLLKKHHDGRWVVAEHLGIGNSRLSDETILKIYRELAEFDSSKGTLMFDEVHVAGLYYRKTPDLWRRILHDQNVLLRLVAEPDNPHDSRAVAIYYRGEHLGYVPRSRNQIPQQLIAAGVQLKAQILKVSSNFDNASMTIGIRAAPHVENQNV